MHRRISGDDVTGLSPDASSLPQSLTRVKERISPQSQQPAALPSVKYDEKIVFEILTNRGREKLTVSTLTADWGGKFVGLRFWNLLDDGTFRPSKRGLNVRADFVEAVAAEMVKAVRS